MSETAEILLTPKGLDSLNSGLSVKTLTPLGYISVVPPIEAASALAAATKRAEEAEAKLAQSTNYVADHDTHPTCVWFANGRVVSVNAAGVLEIRFGKQLEACDE